MNDEEQKIINKFKNIIDTKLPEYKRFVRSEQTYVHRQKKRNCRAKIIKMPTPITELYNKYPQYWVKSDFLFAKHIITQFEGNR